MALYEAVSTDYENEPPIRTIRAAAEWAGVSVRTIQRWRDRFPEIAENRDGVLWFKPHILDRLATASELIRERRRNG